MFVVQMQCEYYIEAEVKRDGMDLTAAEKEAACQEIKDFASEHTGLKVRKLHRTGEAEMRHSCAGKQK